MSNKNYNSNRSNGKKHVFKSLLRWIALALVSATLAAVMVFAFGGLKFENPFNKDINPENLINVNTPGYIKSMQTGHGVEIEVDKYGVISLSGKATDNFSVTVATVTLDPGTYTISGIKDASSVDKFALRVNYSNGGVAFAGIDGKDSFTLVEAETVTVTLQWCEEYNFYIFNPNSKVEPVLVKGDTAGNMYLD